MAFYPFESQFSSSDFNPAFLKSNHKFTFSILPLGGTNIGYNNQQVIRSLVSKVLSGITTDKDYRDILESMANRSTVNQNIESALLSFTYRSKYGFLNFRIKEVENFSVHLKGELTDFIVLPGIQSTVITKIQTLPAQAMHYREYSLGYSLPGTNRKLTAGFRAKLYFGKASFFSGLSGRIQNESGDYILKTDGKVMMSLPEVKILNEDGSTSTDSFTGRKVLDYLFNYGNKGLGIDLGINYRIVPNLSVSLSVIDLGKIRWKSKLNSKSFDVNFAFNKDSIKTELNTVGEEIISKKYDEPFIDPVSKEFKPAVDRLTPFSGKIPLTFYSGLKYNISPSLMISLVDKYVMIKDLSYNSSSIMASFKLNSKISVSTGYAVVDKSFTNIPVAVLINKDFGQIYFGTDNLAAYVIPSASNFAGFTFGTCFYLFRERDKLIDPSEDFPFYQPLKHNRNRKNGLLH